jgi:4-hydroxybenzoate polyprenyltransferase
MTGAAVTLGVNLGLGLCVLTQLSWTTVAASFAIVPVAFLYPLAKRYFKYPQLILGFNFNWGVIVGAIQTGGVLSPAVLICYTAAVLHTLIYDTIYAHQDIKFDKQLGLYSTAYTLPHNTPLYLTFPFTVLLAASCMSAGYSAITIPLLAAMQVALFR